ncbi:pre-peptidase C-terminal domain-containing protein [Oscillatoria sp. FACHB-1407]|uniref:pre-peptidase C-terminal domain-containing protein n=1 Tax=Oscillatoria sp. FACHB-1407 TaxID=2692847 RepID=UPI0016866FD4|nr:pre-peptidase C-terminal domain-containing protein [Oscillatoria sp. FACHB-1407]MBD2462148.1 pre-peptidase C-terminal domain-containing protein [Oscillatoria sp. FACHB-1407]
MFNSQVNASSQLSDNRPSSARNIGTLSGRKVFRGLVGVSDRVDFYSFKVTGRSSFNLALNRLQNNVDVFLLQGRRVLARSTKRGKLAEAINTNLESGTYTIQVSQRSGDSRYTLTLNAASLPAPNPRPKLVSLYRQASDPLPRYGFVDLSTGSISQLPLGNAFGQLTLLDIASSGSDTLAVDLLSGLYRVDVNTGNSTRIGDLGGFLSGIAFGSLGFGPSGTLYTIGTNRTTRQSGLYTVNVAAGGQVTLVANLPGIVDVGDIAYDATSGRFFATANSAAAGGSLLYSIGLIGDAQLVGNIGFDGVGALLFDNGILYGYDSVFALQQRQIIINTTTGVGTVDKLVTLNNQPFSDISGGA